MKFYTDIRQSGDTVFHSYIEDGIRHRDKFKFSPKIYVKSNKDDSHSTIYGDPLAEIDFDTIRDCKEFIQKHKSVANFPMFGNQNYGFQFLSTEYKEEIQYDSSQLDVCYIDIETEVGDSGFPFPETAIEKISLITLHSTKNGTVTFGYRPYTGNVENVPRYTSCDGEQALLRTFLTYWMAHYPDIVSGWNIEGFDIPYIHNRITNILGAESARKLSPYNIVRARNIKKLDTVSVVYDIYGIQCLDYLHLYKKFQTTARVDNYKLDTIGKYVVNEEKLKNPRKSFREFYSGEFDVNKVSDGDNEITILGHQRTLMKNELIRRGVKF